MRSTEQPDNRRAIRAIFMIERSNRVCYLLPAVALETKPGDIVCFNHNTKHAAFGGNTERRMFTISLCRRYPDEELDELRDYIGGAARFWIDRNYGEKMVQTAAPERMRHLEQEMAHDGHLLELSRKTREAMDGPSCG